VLHLFTARIAHIGGRTTALRLLSGSKTPGLFPGRPVSLPRKKAAGGEQEKGEHIGPRNFRKASESENEIENARCESAGGNVFRQNFSFSLCIGFESFLHATFSFN
jgi:hypothetical protein